MPGGDKSGPLGNGPMSGRGMGFCAGYNWAGYAQGMGMSNCGGRGGLSARGRRNRNMMYATGMPGWKRFARGGSYAGDGFFSEYATGEELQMLKRQAEILQEQLNSALNRIKDLAEQTSQEQNQEEGQ